MTTISKAERLARLLSVVLSLDMIQNMVSPAVWILGTSHSVVSTVSRLAAYPQVIAYCWLALAFLMLPYTWEQITGKPCVACTRLACFSLCAGGVLWVFLAYLARSLDYPNIDFLFGFNGLISILMGAVLANSINDEQRAEVPHEA